MPAYDRPVLDAPPVERPALVLFSGGQDSTTCLCWALQTFHRVEALGFRYGQRHAVELEQAQRIADLLGVPYTVLDLQGLLPQGALTDPKGDVNAPHERAPALPASFVPGRNAVFLSVAASFGYARGILDLVGGMCQADYSGYPDCRIGFVQAMQRALGLALEADLRIHVPLMYLTKAQTWKLAKDLGTVPGADGQPVDVLELVREMTHTDYHGDRSERHPWGYGRLDNAASVLRARGYEEAVAKGWI